MKEQFATYEISLFAKEFGFNEECLGIYINTNAEPVLRYNLAHLESQEKAKYIYNADCLAPFWQQIINWFDKSEITIDVISEECDDGDSGDGPVFEYRITYWRTLRKYSSSIQYLKREEALKQAILKVIELCKK